MTLTLLHTAEAHRAAFDDLAAQIAPEAQLRHVVRPDWLSRAQAADAALQGEIAQAVREARGAVLCTCTTLGPMAEGLGILRIDAPMMTKAAQIAADARGDIVMAYCLDSTLAPSAALLDRALERAGHTARVHALSLGQFWPLFGAGQIAPFHAVIASAIRENLSAAPGAACVVLAQASMAGAAPLLAGVGVPVLAAPEMALRAALDLPN
ncbi:MAG TPA: hypothetical protein VIN05_06520 [Roseovarius sp.]